MKIFNNLKFLHYSRFLITKKMPEFKTLRDFGYDFNNAGKLRKINESGELGEEPFQFNISDKHHECQVHYEEIGSAVTQYIYGLLETEVHLYRLPVPKDSTSEASSADSITQASKHDHPEAVSEVTSKAATFVFASKDYDKKNTLLILIHGSGVVRAGQWARSLIINENLDMGTQIPYIKRALSKDYGIMVLNTNDNYTPHGDVISQSSTPEKHGLYVWNNYIANAKASSILIAAHSYGGVVTVALAEKLKEDFEKRVKAIAFTDSVHWYSNEEISQHLKQIARNWVASSSPLDTPKTTSEHDIPRVSAGHKKHEMTSYSCMDSVFKFFDEKLKK